MTVADLGQALEDWRLANEDIKNLGPAGADIRRDEAEQKIKTAIREICDETSNS